MLLLDELRLELEGYRKDMADLYNILNIDKLKEDNAKLQEQSAADGFWDDLENSQKVMQTIKQNEATIENYKKLNEMLEDTLTMIELTVEEGNDEDEATVAELKAEAEKFKAELETTKLTTLLTGEYDSKNAILTFHAGAGGTEAQDWAEMLFRMYNRWAERHNFKVTTLDYLDGGVHRILRISPFDSSGRRQTSFASLEVMPEMDGANLNIEIRPEDLEIDFYRASGAGGQKVNKTSSAVRLTHKPTGIVVSCQTQRSQYQNKDYAMKMLVSKLAEIKEREHLDKIEDIKGVKKEIAWGAQIRSYVFMPYTLAKDTRTGFENGNINAVMDGDLDGFINAYLTALSHGDLQ